MFELLNRVLKYNCGMHPLMNEYLVNYMKYFLDNKIDFYKNQKLITNSGLIVDRNNKSPPNGNSLVIILAAATIFIFVSKKL